MGTRRRIVALAVATAMLTLAACATTPTEDSADPSDTPDAPPVASTPVRPPAPDGASGPRYADTWPELDWPFDDDVARIEAFPAALAAAFDRGAEAGLAFMAQHSWPDGYTADAMLACQLDEPTPTYRELDAQGFRLDFALMGTIPVPGFIYPPTGEYPSASGVRPYLTQLTVTRSRTDRANEVTETLSRVALHPDGRVVLFPMCFEFLPGQFLEHRVTDGHIGGYTDAEAAGDVRVIFGFSPPEAQAEVCGRLAEGDLDALALQIVPPDIEDSGTRIPPRVLEETLTELCAARVR
jgi:hypothetical protein